jgi:hypothetical protein
MSRKPSLESMDDLSRRQFLTRSHTISTSKQSNISAAARLIMKDEVIHTGSFDFRHGSIGNFLITGCRLFFKSLEYFY